MSDGFTVEGEAWIAPNVQIGPGTLIMGPCSIGMPPRGAKPGQLPLVIGRDCIIRPYTTIYAGSTLGDGVQTGQGASIREGNTIGDGSSVGTHATLEPGNRIGKNCRIHSGCFMENVTLGDEVFLGPNVVFTDDPHPPCPRYEDCVGGGKVGRRAAIGGNSTILPGVIVGEGALVGAGSVIVREVPAGMVVAGNPGRVIKAVSELTCRSGLMERPYAWREESQ